MTAPNALMGGWRANWVPDGSNKFHAAVGTGSVSATCGTTTLKIGSGSGEGVFTYHNDYLGLLMPTTANTATVGLVTGIPTYASTCDAKA